MATDHVGPVVDSLRADGLNALTRQQVAANNVKFMTGIFGSPLRLMVGIGLAAAVMIISLTAYTAVIDRRREYGIVKAMGGRAARLVTLALTQTFVVMLEGRLLRFPNRRTYHVDTGGFEPEERTRFFQGHELEGLLSLEWSVDPE